MQLFECGHCLQTVYFDNTHCTACGAMLGFDAQQMDMVSLHPDPDNDQYYQEEKSQTRYVFCANYHEGACNWVIDAKQHDKFCIACRLNRVIPNLSDLEHHRRWRKIELAKHRLIYALLQWQLPLKSKVEDPERGLAFDFKATLTEDERVLTGHDSGLITLNIAEADDIEREMAKNNMAELYRSVLGHFRHEIGHYYWDVLVDQSEFLLPFRQLFGDERLDYQEALQRHYEQGAPLDWSERYISAYATMHPWEDWAETWAHYLHIVDVLETADTFGIKIQPKLASHQPNMHLVQHQNPYFCEDFETIYQAWLPVAFAMNSLNRSMGHDDFYPFLINQKVKEKLSFVHKVIQSAKQHTQLALHSSA